MNVSQSTVNDNIDKNEMSLEERKPVFWGLDQVRHKPQKMGRGLKFQI